MNWVTFLGEGRSGHTVISGILGSHLNSLISEEQKFISKWRRGWSKDQILESLHVAGPGSTRKGQGWPNLDVYQEPLELIGDKCGWDAVNEYTKRNASSSILKDFELFIGFPVKPIVTVRHPLDNIATWIDSPKYSRIYPDREKRGHQMIKRYRRFYKACVELLDDSDYLTVYHEDLVSNTSDIIQKMADWLELPHNKPWRRQSAKNIWNEPRLRRVAVNYSHSELEGIQHIIDTNPLFEFYRN